MKTLNIEPMAGGGTTEYTRSISDKALSEQFCTVAKDIRSTLQVLRESIEIQKQIFTSIENVSQKLDDNNQKVNELQTSILDLSSKNCEHVDQLTKNTMIIAQSINDEQTLNTIIEKVNQNVPPSAG